MKKLTLLMAVVFVLSTVMVHAQTEKGKYLVMGSSSLVLDFGKNKTKSDGTTTQNYNYFDLNLIPMAGYTIMDNLPVGAYLDMNICNTKYKDSDSYDNSTSLSIGPFARYYITDFNGLKPMAEIATGIGMMGSKYDYGYGETKNNAFLWEFWLGAGATYFLTDYIGIDGMVGYYHESLKYKAEEDGGSRSEHDYTDSYGEIYFYFGIVVMLSK